MVLLQRAQEEELEGGLGGVGTPRTGRGRDRPLHEAQPSCGAWQQAGCLVGPRMGRSPFKELNTLIMP